MNIETNYLAGFLSLIDYLKNQLEQPNGPLDFVTALGAQSQLQDLPSIPGEGLYLAYLGDTVGNDDSTGSYQIMQQRFLLALAVRNDDADFLKRAGELISAVLRAVSGFEPYDENGDIVDIGSLRRESSPFANDTNRRGHSLFYFLFYAHVAYSGYDSEA